MGPLAGRSNLSDERRDRYFPGRHYGTKKQEQLARESEARLRESQDRLRLATEAADIGTFDFFPKTGELQLSDRSKELFGMPPEAKVTYETYLAGVHPDDRHIVHETAQRVRQPGGAGRVDLEYRTIGIQDGRERWVAERGRFVLDPSGEETRFIGTMLDITDSKNAEILLQRARRARRKRRTGRKINFSRCSRTSPNTADSSADDDHVAATRAKSHR